MLAESGSGSGCGGVKAQPQSEQRSVCWSFSLVLSSMVLSTTRLGGEGGSFFDTSFTCLLLGKRVCVGGDYFVGTQLEQT